MVVATPFGVHARDHLFGRPDIPSQKSELLAVCLLSDSQLTLPSAQPTDSFRWILLKNRWAAAFAASFSVRSKRKPSPELLAHQPPVASQIAAVALP